MPEPVALSQDEADQIAEQIADYNRLGDLMRHHAEQFPLNLDHMDALLEAGDPAAHAFLMVSAID